MVFSLGSQLNRVVAIGYIVGFVVSGPVAWCLDGHGFCLVPGWTGLPEDLGQ